MRFNLGEVWKSVEAGGGEPRRAVVVAIEDEGRSGRLFFDNGDEQSFLWAELTQAGRWQVDTSPKPTRRADELKEMILRQIQRHPVCPAGMSVEIRSTRGSDWEALSIPPPGQHIAYADCAHFISTAAGALRSLYGLRLTPVEARAGAPLDWLNSGDDAADAAVRMTEERRRRSIAATQPPTEPISPSVPVSSEPSASTAPSTVELTARATIQNKASLGLSVNRASPGSTPIDIAGAFERRLTERPAEIRKAARALSKAIAEQIEELNASKPNEPERLAQQNDFIAFLQTIAAGLDELAAALDRAIAAGSGTSPEPILLGKAGEIARKLSAAVTEGLERNRTYIVDCTIKFCVFAAGFTLLHACGVDGYIAGAVAALMNVKLSGGGDSKK
jgi:hypothetical protein